MLHISAAPAHLNSHLDINLHVNLVSKAEDTQIIPIGPLHTQRGSHDTKCKRKTHTWTYPSQLGCTTKSTSSLRRMKRLKVREDKGLRPAARSSSPWCHSERRPPQLCNPPTKITQIWNLLPNTDENSHLKEKCIDFVSCGAVLHQWLGNYILERWSIICFSYAVIFLKFFFIKLWFVFIPDSFDCSHSAVFPNELRVNT